MKINVEFNLPDEKWDFKCFNLSTQAASTILELDNYLRGVIKYNNEENKTPKDLAEFIRSNYLCNLVNELNDES